MTTDTPSPGDPPGKNPDAGIRGAALAAFGVAVFFLGAFAVALPVQSRFPPPIWPADGLVLGVLLLLAPRRWAPWLAIVFVASLAVFVQSGLALPLAILGALIAVAEPAILALGLMRLAGPEVRIDNLRGLAAFFVGLVPLAGLTALLEAAVVWLRTGAQLREAWTISFISDVLVCALFAPLVLAWGRRGIRAAVEKVRGRVAEVIVLYVGLGITVQAVFGTRPQDAPFVPALAYLCAPFLIWAALRFGLRAATLGLAAFALLAYHYTANGSGPFAVEGTIGWSALLNLQGYLATVAVSTLFAAALLVERHQAAEDTEAWRKRYEAVIRASENLLYELDPASGSVLWDGDTRAVLGIEPGAIGSLGPWMERVHPEDRPRLKGLRKAFLSGSTTRVALEYRVRRDDGEYAAVGVNGFSIRDRDPEGAPRLRVIGYVADISERQKAEAERRRLEAQLKQAEKMEAVGRLAGGIAHDFNNILGAILGYGELAQARAADEVMKRYLDTIMGAGNRAKALIAQILAFSRAEGIVKAPVTLGPLVNEVAELVRGALTEPLEVRVSLTGDDAVVMGDATRLHQLLMNLCTNASHAMAAGGLLEITLAPERLAEPRRVRSGEIPAGDYARLEVRDNGAGMTPEVLDRIFEPFFTTKGAGRGTGLGLALVHSVVREHQGFVDVESEPGRGSTFRMWFPREATHAGAEAPAAAAPPRARSGGGGGKSVLAVDDEPEVLAALEEMLATLGYEPAGFTDSAAALEAFRADPGRFDAMVSDQKMPGMTGTDLATEVRKLRPDLPVVIATGFGGEGFEARAKAAGVGRVLRKPYAMGDIGEALARVLQADRE